MTGDWKDLYRKPGEGRDSQQYTKKAMDHFQNPRNVGRIEDYDGIGAYGDPTCGDYLEVTLRVDESEDRIAEVRFLVYGCAGAISTSSVMTELVKGKTFREALHLCDDDVIRALGGIPENKRHCSLLGIHALQAAIADNLIMRKMISTGAVAGKREYRQQRKLDMERFGVHECDGTCEQEILDAGDRRNKR